MKSKFRKVVLFALFFGGIGLNMAQAESAAIPYDPENNFGGGGTLNNVRITAAGIELITPQLAYEADALPQNSVPAWTRSSYSDIEGTIENGTLHINANGTAEETHGVSYNITDESVSSYAENTVTFRLKVSSNCTEWPDIDIEIFNEFGAWFEFWGKLANPDDPSSGYPIIKITGWNGKVDCPFDPRDGLWHVYKFIQNSDVFKFYVDGDCKLTYIDDTTWGAANSVEITYGGGTSIYNHSFESWLDYFRVYHGVYEEDINPFEGTFTSAASPQLSKIYAFGNLETKENNLCLGKNTTSSAAAEDSSLAVNGNLDDYFNWDYQTWWEVDLGESYSIDKILINYYLSWTDANIYIQYWNGSDWMDITELPATPIENMAEEKVYNIQPVYTSKLRVFRDIPSGPQPTMSWQLRIYEFEAYDSSLSGATNITYKTQTGINSTFPFDPAQAQAAISGQPIQSPPNQYIKWQASLTTSDPVKTPRLSALSINYLVDNSTPTNWGNVQLYDDGAWKNITSWTKDMTPDIRINVQDIESGLGVNSAFYRYSVDSGTVWSGWLSADCFGADGTKQISTVTALAVPFNSDSANQNLIQFKVSDKVNNVGYSPVYSVKIDATPPDGEYSDSRRISVF